MNPFRIIVIASLLTLCAQAQEPAQDASLANNPVYQQNCAKCHGKKGDGRTFAGPSLVAEKTTSVPADDLRTTITNGKHRMPKFGEKLSAADIDTLVTQIKGQKKP